MSTKPERRTIRWSSLVTLGALAGIGVAIVAYLSPPPPPVSANGPPAEPKIRVPMFVDPNLVRPTPRFRFTFDAPETLARLRQQEKLDAVVSGAADDLQRCVRLMAWTRRQWEPGTPSPYPPLDALIILRDIRRGFTGGFCAQYNYVLAQALQSFGIPARYVTLLGHEVIEARPREMARWICLDPLYNAWYGDEAGRPLPVHDVHRRLLEGRPVSLSEGHLAPDPASHLELFRQFAVWLKNDHVGSPINFTDLARYKVYFLDDAAALDGVPLGALTTTEPLDLYPD